MASASITSGRVNPVLQQILAGFGGNNDRRIGLRLPCRMSVPSWAFKGQVRTIPLKDQYADKTVFGTGVLKRQSGSAYHDSTRSRSFATTDYECFEYADSVKIDDKDQDQTNNPAISGLDIRTSELAILNANILDDQENTILAAAFSASYATSTAALLTGGAGQKWNAAGSSPSLDGGKVIPDIVRAAVGARPTYAVIGYQVASALMVHQETLNVLGTKSAGLASVGDTIKTLESTLDIWRVKWGLKAIYVAEAQYNSNNPAVDGALADMITDSIAFHCDQGMSGALPVATSDGAQVRFAGGPLSLAILHEMEPRTYEDRMINPHGTQIAMKHRMTTVLPSNMTGAAYVLTDVL